MDQIPRRSRIAAFLPALLIFASASVVIVAHVGAYRPISPFDEGVHFDYAYKAARGELVRKGDKLGQTAMREIACRGIDLAGLILPPCMRDGSYDPDAFPNLGYNSADIHPPVFYGISGITGRVLQAVGIAESSFTATRLAGILWFALGLLTVWYLGKEAGVPKWPLVIVVGLLTVSPQLVHASATVNNDGTALVAGGALAWLTMRWERGAAPLWVLGLGAFLVPVLKSTHVIVVGLCALYLLLRRTRDMPAERKSNWSGILALVAGAALSLIAWVAIHSAIAEPVVTPLDRRFEADSLNLADVLAPIGALSSPVSHGLPTEVMGGGAYQALGAVLGILMITGAVGTLLRASISDRHEHLAAAAGLTMLAGGTLLSLGNLLVLGEAIGVSPRYGFSLVPALAVAGAAAIRSRAATWVLGGFGVIHAAIVLGSLIAA